MTVNERTAKTLLSSEILEAATMAGRSEYHVWEDPHRPNEVREHYEQLDAAIEAGVAKALSMIGTPLDDHEAHVVWRVLNTTWFTAAGEGDPDVQAFCNARRKLRRRLVDLGVVERSPRDE